MITQINNNERVFMVVKSTGASGFCNISELNLLVDYLGCNPNYFKIYHFWKNKATKVSKKYLKELFQANQLKQEFAY